nr:oxygenase MpaB family protein [Conyzicola lurida]
MRDISDEAVLLAGGARAILLQIALPAVGHGVARHSDFTADPLRRLRNTLSYLYVLVYGSDAEIELITGYVNRAHGPVRSDSDPAYNAFDPDQQLWVAATLYDSAIAVYERVFGRLSPDDADSLYAEYAVVGTALQMPADLWPRDRSAFAGYWRETVAGLRVDDEARRVSRDLLHPATGPLWVKAVMPPVRFLTAGLLSPELRRAFDLPWDDRRERRFRRTLRVLAAVYPRLPKRLRRWPARHYLAAFRAHAR